MAQNAAFGAGYGHKWGDEKCINSMKQTKIKWVYLCKYGRAYEKTSWWGVGIRNGYIDIQRDNTTVCTKKAGGGERESGENA